MAERLSANAAYHFSFVRNCLRWAQEPLVYVNPCGPEALALISDQRGATNNPRRSAESQSRSSARAGRDWPVMPTIHSEASVNTAPLLAGNGLLGPAFEASTRTSGRTVTLPATPSSDRLARPPRRHICGPQGRRHEQQRRVCHRPWIGRCEAKQQRLYPARRNPYLCLANSYFHL